MESITALGVPVLWIIVAGAMVWASMQAIKQAIAIGKWYYIAVTAGLALIAAALATTTSGLWSWKTFCWIAWGGWLASHLLHKFYAKYLEAAVVKALSGQTPKNS
jgi:hypothetical protein